MRSINILGILWWEIFFSYFKKKGVRFVHGHVRDLNAYVNERICMVCVVLGREKKFAIHVLKKNLT